jgi:transposase
MLGSVNQTPIYLYAGVADMRKAFDGLLGLVTEAGMGDPLSGAWFVFRNRRADRLKILYFDRDGLAIWYKRLERGRFQWPRIEPGQSSVSVQASELRLILEGIDLDSVRRRRRWSSGGASKAVENRSKLDNRAAHATLPSFTDEPAATHQSRGSTPPDQGAVRDSHDASKPGGVAEPAVVRA